MSLNEYASSSTSIVRGYVVEKAPVFPNQGMAYTSHQVVVTDILKRDRTDVELGAAIEVLTPGARDATRWTRVHGAPKLNVNDEVLLFLWRNPTTETHVVTGWNQGTYHIRWDEEQGRQRPVGLHAQRDWGVDQFVTKVREEVARLEQTATEQEAGR